MGAIAVVVGITIGSGIFRTPASVTNRRLPGRSRCSRSGPPAVSLRCAARSVSRSLGAFPETGGIFIYIRKVGKAARVSVWMAARVHSRGGGRRDRDHVRQYMLRRLGFDPAIAPYDGWVHYVAACAIAVIATLNYVGVRWGRWFRTDAAVAKFFGLLFIVVIAITIGIRRRADISPR